MERLQKVMASRGVASRRACEEMILAGRVTVNGKVVSEMGTKVAPGDIIAVDGKELPSDKDPLVYLMLNKPRGCVTTVKDPQGRTTVMDLLDNQEYRVFPVGRLDFDTEGLLLLTNDGDLSYALTHPSHGVEKTYQAVVYGTPSKEELDRLRSGIQLEDGKTAPAKVKVLKSGPKSKISLTIHEGKKRQVRRMLQEIGHPVINLKRTHFGPLSLKGLAPGQYRHLSSKEIRELKAIEKNVLLKDPSGGERCGQKAGKRSGSGIYRKR
jgi:23S rRNA pseudouridine2605 synthase